MGPLINSQRDSPSIVLDQHSDHSHLQTHLHPTQRLLPLSARREDNRMEGESRRLRASSKANNTNINIDVSNLSWEHCITVDLGLSQAERVFM
jgi:hypothetical protein